MKKATIYHNPKCGTSRNVLAMLKDAGYEPEIVEYLETGWTKDQLAGLFKTMRVSAREALRTKGTNAEELGLIDAPDAKIIAAMVKDPVLVNRPIVVTPKGAKLCRPAEIVQDLL